MKLLQVKTDNYFHDLINQDNMDIVEWIVMLFLDKSYHEVHGKCVVENIRLTRTNKKDRNKYVDFIVRYEEHYLIFELNNWFKGSLFRNIVFGMTKTIAFYQNKEKNNYYDNIIRVSVINLNWYNRNTRKNKKRIDQIFGYDSKNKGIFFEVLNVTLDKYAEIAYNKIDTKEKFYKLLTIDNKKDLLEFSKDEPLLKKYVKKIIDLSSNENYKEEIMTEEMEERLRYLDSYGAGQADGIEKTKKETVISMFENKLDLNLISKISKLPLKKVKAIINSKFKNQIE